MASSGVTSPKYQFLLYALQFLLLLMQNKVECYQYKVGDLDAWGIPTSSNPHVYTNWAKSNNHIFTIGDSLMFLYPPSQDSVIQVTEQSYNTCNLKNPILYMNNGNSLFNITKSGEFYFTSGVQGHCEKSQKLHVSVAGNASSIAFSPSHGPATAPSYPNVFGSIPMAPSSSLPSTSSSSSLLTTSPVVISASIGFFLMCALVSGSI
ncbi:hypothetical protein CsSME_00050751 [Camellia sinensis var. sinensis]